MAKCIPLVFDTVQLSEEEKMAKIFCQAANDYFNDIDGKIFAIPSLRKVRDMDLVVWMRFNKYKTSINTGYNNNPESQDEKELKRRSVRDVWFNTVLMVIELKKHNTSDSLSIKNGKLYVKYGDNFENASDQNFNQIFHLQNFLGGRLNIAKGEVPRIQNFIWLSRCIEKPSKYDELDNIIYGQINFKELLEQICRLSPPVSFDSGKNISFNSCKSGIVDIIENYFEELRKEKANGLGIISRTKLNIILKKEIDIEHNRKLNEIGDKLTIIKGKPGTGKTIHLVHLAFHLKNEEYKPVFLTYNKALVQDIDRMMHYSGYANSIEIRTIHSFFYCILYSVGIVATGFTDIGSYEGKLEELYELIKEEGGDDIREVLKVKFDTLLIDEAQDCTDLEKELLLKIFEPRNIVLSIGNRQIVRKKEINWTENIARKHINVINLNISHRNKKDLVDYFNAFSTIHFNQVPWNLKENRNLTGGKLNILSNLAYNQGYHRQLMFELVEEGNSMYDLMFLVPSADQGVNFAEGLNKILDAWEVKAFNNTIIENKEKPFPIDEHRILNYQSCRGLEAWILVCWNLDVIVKNIRAYFDSSKSVYNINLHINNWLLMIFTRAIDTLIITFQDMNSDEAQMILNLAQSEHFSHMAIIK